MWGEEADGDRMHLVPWRMSGVGAGGDRIPPDPWKMLEGAGRSNLHQDPQRKWEELLGNIHREAHPTQGAAPDNYIPLEEVVGMIVAGHTKQEEGATGLESKQDSVEFKKSDLI